MAGDPLIGSVLSQKYLVIRFIGRGGMGRVYEAKHEGLGRRCALKVLSSDLDDDGSSRERFLWEPRMASEFDHPNIIRVTDVDEDNGRLYIVMDLIGGSDLRTILRSGPVPASRAVQIVGQAAEALDHAHARGLIHRDVKPANILVSESDHVVLTDFGLAKSASRAQSLTVSGGFFGSIAYAAPEQFDSRGAEPASDRYALACVLWECLSGKTPFAASSDLEIIRGHLDGAVPRLGGDLAPGLDDVFAKALAKDPAARYPTARSLVDAVATVLAEEQRGHTRAIPLRTERPAAPPAETPPIVAPPPAVPALEPPGSADLSRATARYERPRERPPAVVPSQARGPGAARRLTGALRRRVVLGLFALPIAAVGGLALGDSTGSTRHLSSTRTVTQVAPAPRRVAVNDLAITLPATWRSGSLPAPLAAASQRVGLFARERSAPSLFLAVLEPKPTLWLPPGTKTTGAAAVELGSREGLRFDERATHVGAGSQGAFFLAPYVTSTDRGDVLIACGRSSAAAGGVSTTPLAASFLQDCERLASTLRIGGARPLALLPLAKDVQAAQDALRSLSASRTRAGSKLRSKRRAQQIAAAASLATSYASAAKRIAALRPALGIRGARARVLADLRAEGGAFGALATAGRDGAATRWKSSVATVGRRDAQLLTDLHALDDALAGKAYAPV